MRDEFRFRYYGRCEIGSIGWGGSTLREKFSYTPSGRMLWGRGGACVRVSVACVRVS
jgi:hypothetical protein